MSNTTVEDSIGSFLRSLISTSGLLITLSIGLYQYTSTAADYPHVYILYAAIGYLIAIITGIISHGALISSIHFKDEAFGSLWVKIPAIVQMISFSLASGILVYLIYEVVT